MNVLVGAREHDVGDDGKANRTLALHESGLKGIAVEGGGKAMALGEDIPHPLPAEGSGHQLSYDGTAIGVDEFGLLLQAADGLSVSGIVHSMHRVDGNVVGILG